jgi:hypothetical protein
MKITIFSALSRGREEKIQNRKMRIEKKKEKKKSERRISSRSMGAEILPEDGQDDELASFNLRF